MESLLVKIFATALALSQVTTTPDAVKTQFDRGRDQEEVARLLSAGCAWPFRERVLSEVQYQVGWPVRSISQSPA